MASSASAGKEKELKAPCLLTCGREACGMAALDKKRNSSSSEVSSDPNSFAHNKYQLADSFI